MTSTQQLHRFQDLETGSYFRFSGDVVLVLMDANPYKWEKIGDATRLLRDMKQGFPSLQIKPFEFATVQQEGLIHNLGSQDSPGAWLMFPGDMLIFQKGQKGKNGLRPMFTPGNPYINICVSASAAIHQVNTHDLETLDTKKQATTASFLYAQLTQSEGFVSLIRFAYQNHEGMYGAGYDSAIASLRLYQEYFPCMTDALIKTVFAQEYMSSS